MSTLIPSPQDMDPRPLAHDLQASAPEVRIGLSRAGVRGVNKAIRLRWGQHEKLVSADVECTVDLDPSQKGVHMSRFPELFEEAIEEVVIGESLLAEQLAEHIASHILERQHALRAEVALDALDLVGIVERSMSSPVYELLKRPDELFVVEHAHLQPRFVEDSVRHALAETLRAYPELGDGDFLFSRQLNLETIHTHDVVAERFGTAGELRAELEGAPHEPRHTTLADWLSG